MLVPVVTYLAIVYSQYVALPNEDDYHALFGFALQWHHAPDFLSVLKLIVGYQHNEYKMPVPYSLLSLELSLTGHLHIPLWIWTGNLLALVALVPFWLSCARERPVRERLLAFVPVVWLLLNVSYGETLNFAICGIQEMGVIVLSLACIYCITRPDLKSNYLGCVFLFLACGTYANAFMLVPIGFVLFYRNKRTVLCAWVAVTATILALFLYRYHFLPHPRASVAKMVAFFTALVGSPFGLHGQYLGAIAVGAVVLVLFGILVRQKAWEVQPFGFWVEVWLLLGYALTSYGRSAGSMADALPSRYKVYADIILAATYLQFLHLWLNGRLPRLRLRIVLPAFAAFLVFFQLFSSATGWYRLHLKHEYVRHGMNRYLESAGQVSPLWYADPLLPWMVRPGIQEEARELLTESLDRHLYRLPDTF